MGETYQIWRDEYPEDKLVHRCKSPRGVPRGEAFTAVVIHLKDGGGGYKLYCKGGPSFVLPRCTNMALPSLDNRNYDGNDKHNTSKQISDLEKRKPSIEVVCLASKYFPGDGKLKCLASLRPHTIRSLKECLLDKGILACVSRPLPSGKLDRRRGVCDSPLIIVYRNNFAQSRYVKPSSL